MHTKVKICGLTRSEDARAATRLGADYLGVIMYAKSPRCVQDEDLEDLLFFIPDGRRVMVDVAIDCDVLRSRLDLGFDYYQIHFDPSSTPLETVRTWSEIVTPSRLWLAPRLKPEESFPEQLLPFATTFLIDAYKEGAYGGTGVKGDWSFFKKLKGICKDKRLILAGGLNPENAKDALTATAAEVLDFNSGVETAPGLKDLSKMAAVIKTVHAQ